MVFSSRFACPVCGYSLSELEPRTFSFNNPAGACPACDGLGVRQFFDPARVVQDPELSLAEGAIRGWDRRNVYYFHMLRSLAEHYGFAVETPFEHLQPRQREAILYGSGEERIDFGYLNDQGDVIRRRHTFEGVIPNTERRDRETESAMIRESLARFLTVAPCSECSGTRLRREARHVFVAGRTLPEVSADSVGMLHGYFHGLELSGRRGHIAEKILHEIRARLRFLVDVGLEYLTLERSADTLSGGEAQRIRLASQIGAGLVGVLYVLDEPSIGLHQRDNARLLATLTRLRDLGNTVIVVEHDEEAIRSADQVVDMGPGAAVHGGHVVAQGTPAEIEAAAGSLTGDYLSGRRRIEVPRRRVPVNPKRMLHIRDAHGNNLRHVDASIPLGVMTCVTGVSGSGKSTLINHTLYPVTALELNRASAVTPAPHGGIEGLEHLDKVVDIDQSPIGRTPRSNPATYVGLFTPIRELFAATAEARSRGYKPGRFSFNVKGGRCEACHGDGVIKVEMHFLPDIYVTCDVCQGRRYNRETLDVRYKGRDIREVLEMTVEEARAFFDPVPLLARRLQTLMDVGLSYVRRAERHDPVRRRGPAREARARARQARDGAHPLHPRRAHHRPALRGHSPAPGRAASLARIGQHRDRHRAQSGRDQDRRLDHRPRPGGRRRRRPRGGKRHTRAGGPSGRLPHRSLPRRGPAPGGRPARASRVPRVASRLEWGSSDARCPV